MKIDVETDSKIDAKVILSTMSVVSTTSIVMQRWMVAQALILANDRVRLMRDIGYSVKNADLRGVLDQCYEWDRLKRIQSITVTTQ